MGIMHLIYYCYKSTGLSMKLWLTFISFFFKTIIPKGPQCFNWKYCLPISCYDIKYRKSMVKSILTVYVLLKKLLIKIFKHIIVLTYLYYTIYPFILLNICCLIFKGYNTLTQPYISPLMRIEMHKIQGRNCWMIKI